jgi:carbon-monoxide dehydrogenase iron sulfur subunit
LKLLKFKPELCCECGSCMDVCSMTWFKHVDRAKSAIIISKLPDAKTSVRVCNQCGDCIDICPVKAIERTPNGVRIKKDICVGCLACVGFCPSSAMFFNVDVSHPIKCSACGVCVKECPVSALSIEDV